MWKSVGAVVLGFLAVSVAEPPPSNAYGGGASQVSRNIAPQVSTSEGLLGEGILDDDLLSKVQQFLSIELLDKPGGGQSYSTYNPAPQSTYNVPTMLAQATSVQNSFGAPPSGGYSTVGSSFNAPGSGSSYSAPSHSYSAPSHSPSSYSGYSNSAYSAQSDSYASQDASYGVPSSSYGPPNSNFGAPGSNYDAPNSNYGPPKSSYGPPQSNSYGPSKKQKPRGRRPKPYIRFFVRKVKGNGQGGWGSGGGSSSSSSYGPPKGGYS